MQENAGNTGVLLSMRWTALCFLVFVNLNVTKGLRGFGMA
jgi:hypothetical protein